MQTSTNDDDRSVTVLLGDFLPAHRVYGGYTIIDLDSANRTLIGIELIRICTWLSQRTGFSVHVPPMQQPDTLHPAIEYDETVDCMYIRLFANSSSFSLPYDNCEVPFYALLDSRMHLKGITVMLDPVDYAAFRDRDRTTYADWE